MKFSSKMKAAMALPPRPRNVRIHGRRTSMRLETPFWTALEEIASTLEMPIETLCERIADTAHRGNLSSAIRVFVLAWSHKQARKQPRGHVN
jgi:predicted DNA-binding ribbon-helix-helix protein